MVGFLTVVLVAVAACLSYLSVGLIVGFRVLATPEALRFAGLLAAGPVAILGGIAALVTADPVIVVIASAVGAAPVQFVFWRDRWTRQLGARLSAISQRGEVDDGDIAELRALIATKSGDDVQFAAMGLMRVANVAHQIGRFDKAAEIILSLPAELDDELRLWRATDLAWAYFESGEFKAARSWLEDVNGLATRRVIHPIGGDVSGRHQLLDGILCAYEGRAQAAQAFFDEVTASNQWEALWIEAARIHAHASLGQRDQASARLADIRQRLGPDAIGRILRPEGPATALAQELALSHPYR